jgi:uncharacterized membrane protein YkoI
MKSLIAALMVALLGFPPAAFAGGDHDRARQAVEDGRIMPLKEILTRAEGAYPGQLIEAELEGEGGKMVYEIKMLTKDGQLMKLLYDARTGEMLRAKGLGGVK